MIDMAGMSSIYNTLQKSVAINSSFIPKSFIACKTQTTFVIKSKNQSDVQINYDNIPFAGHMQTVQTQIRRRVLRRLIRVSTICLRSDLLRFD